MNENLFAQNSYERFLLIDHFNILHELMEILKHTLSMVKESLKARQSLQTPEKIKIPHYVRQVYSFRCTLTLVCYACMLCILLVSFANGRSKECKRTIDTVQDFNTHFRSFENSGTIE